MSLIAMEMRPADIGIWAHTGGYVVGFDDQGEGDERETHTHVVTDINLAVRLIVDRLLWLDESKASAAAERALKGNRP